ncbi:Beta-1,3-galactosyltransferase 5 [Orchesella cincta]|uniref:Hexosyltransferase n=1 Tax=Orchesella cincta TaxID=48709 RepID=A0A1D2ND49_ORCCI|nr:Beta-1,3-galactosyltransferase 5 [Orchesella cincta]
MRVHIKFITYILLGAILTAFVFLVLLLCIISDWEPISVRVQRVFEQKSNAPYKPKLNKFSITEMMGSTSVIDVVKPDEKTVILEPTMPFLKGGKSKRPFAVIMVTSLARFFNQRQAIRSTWYKWAHDLNIRIFFMIGHTGQNPILQNLEEEQRIHDDLIIDNFEEGYYKLPAKILRMVKWFNTTYLPENSPRYLIKTDHDVFINLLNLVNILRETPYYSNLVSLSGQNNSKLLLPDSVNIPFDSSDVESYFVGGQKFAKPEVEVDPDSKWYMDSKEREMLGWSGPYLPTYLNGPCYIISGNVVGTIYEASFNVPIFPFEDVYLIGLVAYDRLSLAISDIGQQMWLDKSYYCLVKNRTILQRMVAFHPLDHPSSMVKVCRRLPTCKRQMSSSSTSNNRNCNLLASIAKNA